MCALSAAAASVMMLTQLRHLIRSDPESRHIVAILGITEHCERKLSSAMPNYGRTTTGRSQYYVDYVVQNAVYLECAQLTHGTWLLGTL